jgi:hypothetical protein
LGAFLLCLIAFRGENLKVIVESDGLKLLDATLRYCCNMSRIVLLGEVNYLIYSPPMKKSLSKIWITLSCFVASGSSHLAADQAAETTSVPEPSAILIGGLCGIFFLLWRRK